MIFNPSISNHVIVFWHCHHCIGSLHVNDHWSWKKWWQLWCLLWITCIFPIMMYSQTWCWGFQAWSNYDWNETTSFYFNAMNYEENLFLDTQYSTELLLSTFHHLHILKPQCELPIIVDWTLGWNGVVYVYTADTYFGWTISTHSRHISEQWHWRPTFSFNFHHCLTYSILLK